ncbi:MAG: hypothetical protein AAGI23_11415 [Bacteroidota bacterium]
MQEKRIPTTFEELQQRKEALSRAVKLHEFNAKRSLDDATSELPKFLLKKAAVPVGVLAASAIGVSQLTNLFTDNSASDTATETVTFQRQSTTDSSSPQEITFERPVASSRQVEVEQKPSLLHRLWLFALPFVQPYIKDFVKSQLQGRVKV